MQERILGKDLKVSAVGLGCMGFSHAYGMPTEKKEAVCRIQQAVEMGYIFFSYHSPFLSFNHHIVIFLMQRFQPF